MGAKNPRADSSVLVIILGAKAMTDKSLFCYPKRAKNILVIGRTNVSYSDLRTVVPNPKDNRPACLGTGGILKHTVVVRLHPLILSLKGKLQIRLMSSRGSQCVSIWYQYAKIFFVSKSIITNITAGFV